MAEWKKPHLVSCESSVRQLELKCKWREWIHPKKYSAHAVQRPAHNNRNRLGENCCRFIECMYGNWVPKPTHTIRQNARRPPAPTSNIGLGCVWFDALIDFSWRRASSIPLLIHFATRLSAHSANWYRENNVKQLCKASSAYANSGLQKIGLNRRYRLSTLYTCRISHREKMDSTANLIKKML